MIMIVIVVIIVLVLLMMVTRTGVVSLLSGRISVEDGHAGGPFHAP